MAEDPVITSTIAEVESRTCNSSCGTRRAMVRGTVRRMRTASIVIALLPLTAHADDIADRAKALHQAAIVVDTHLDAPDQLAKKWADVANKGATDHFDIPRAKQGGLTAPFFSIYVAAAYADNGGAAKRALQLIDITHRTVDAHPKDMMLATTPADIRQAKRDGKLAILMGIEGGHAIEDSLPVLREMYRAGVRYMTLTHTNTNHWADSSGAFYEPDFDRRSTWCTAASPTSARTS